MPIINFTKAVGTGNDFIIIDNRGKSLEKRIKDFSKFATVVCDRKKSIGADGILILENSKIADFKMRIINPDGSEASMCGNGARCIALYAYTKKVCGDKFEIETGAGIVEASIKGKNVKLKMTDPQGLALKKKINVGGKSFTYSFVNTGVPHVVYFVNNIEEMDVHNIGRLTRYHKAFAPKGTNVNFVKVLGKNKIRVRTYERGVEGETLACGTGSVASGIISHIEKKVSEPVSVITSSGEYLKIHFEIKKEKIANVYLEGPAALTFTGGINYV